MGSAAVGFVDDSAAALTLVPLATVGWGVFPTLTALLTPEASGDQQGHLQGALWATTCVEIKILRRVRVVLHAIDATPARWRGDAGSSPLDRARTAAPSPRNDLV